MDKKSMKNCLSDPHREKPEGVSASASIVVSYESVLCLVKVHGSELFKIRP